MTGVAVDGHAAGAGVEADGAAIELALGVASRAAQQRAHAREHFFEMERLGDIVVGASIEALHLVAPAVACGEHEHRHGAPGAAPGFQHRDAVHLRQADIEDHGVVRLALAEIVPFLAVEGAVDHVAGFGERGRQLPIEIGIILDHEETHEALHCCCAEIQAADSRPRALLCHYIWRGEDSETDGKDLAGPTRPAAAGPWRHSPTRLVLCGLSHGTRAVGSGLRFQHSQPTDA